MKNIDNYPKISLITVTYNSERTIERTIKSIEKQQYSNLEYIIVDGKSTDGTIDVIKKYEDKIITRWISEKDRGISDAFNKGIRMSTGDIIGIVNSDDGLEPGALYALAEHYSPEIDVYRGNIFFWNEATGAKIREVPSMHFSYSGWKLNVCHQGTFVSAKAYRKYGMFNLKYNYAMDLDLLMRFERLGASFKYISYDMAYFTMDGLTFQKFTKENWIELESIIIANGGSRIDVAKFRILKSSKLLLKKIVNNDTALKIKNIKDNL